MNSKRYNYSCATCEGPVVKTPTGDGERKGVKHGLHGWECNNCGRGAKVSRTLK
jgi:hypothetical protein